MNNVFHIFIYFNFRTVTNVPGNAESDMSDDTTISEESNFSANPPSEKRFKKTLSPIETYISNAEQRHNERMALFKTALEQKPSDEIDLFLCPWQKS